MTLEDQILIPLKQSLVDRKIGKELDDYLSAYPQLKNFSNSKNLEVEVILPIRQLLWNELELELIAFHEIIETVSLLLWKWDLIQLIDLKVIISKLRASSQFNKDDICRLAFVLSGDLNLIGFSEWVESVLETANDFGNLIPSYTKTLDLYRNHSSNEIAEHGWLDLESIVNSIMTRPEYLKEILENTSSDLLVRCLDWINIDVRDQVMDFLFKSLVEPINTLSGLNDKFESNHFLEEFPMSYNVLGERISLKQAQTLDISKLESVPQKYSKDWLPKFVYSTPEKDKRIKIYFPGGKGIGHSAILVKSTDGLLLFDFGMSVVNTSIPRWTSLLSKLDAVFISHAHLDHSGALPLLYSNKRTLPWFGTSETRIMCEMLWNDTAKIVGKEELSPSFITSKLTSKSNITNTLKNFNQVNVKKTLTILPDITVTPYNAAHLFGSVGYEIDIAGKRILYTGDFNLNETTSFKGAKFNHDLDYTIFDGTNYQQPKTPRLPSLEVALKDSQRILIPAFSMGRSQELLFHLKKLGADKDWKIYLLGMGGKLARRLNLTVGPSGGGRSTGVSILPTIDSEDFTEGSIVISGQGMLQSGTARRLFDHTKEDENTSVILCGYQAPNTLGYHLLNQHNYLTKNYSQKVFKVRVSGHSTPNSLNKFIDSLTGKKIMVHSPEYVTAKTAGEDLHIPDIQKPVDVK